MGILGSGDDVDPEEQREKQHARAKDRTAQKAALEQSHNQTVQANPQFLDQLQNFDLDSEEFPEISSELGPIGSGAAILGNRPEEYENRRRWLNENIGERLIAEGEPGRLCKGKLLELAHGVHKRDGKSPPEPRTLDERRALRSALQRITNVETLSIQARLLRSLTESVAVTKTEGQSQNNSTAEKASRFIG